VVQIDGESRQHTLVIELAVDSDSLTKDPGGNVLVTERRELLHKQRQADPKQGKRKPWRKRKMFGALPFRSVVWIIWPSDPSGLTSALSRLLPFLVAGPPGVVLGHSPSK